MQVLYLFIKRFFKAFVCSPIEKYLKSFLSGKKISPGNERKTKAFIEKWSKMMQLGNFTD